MFKKVEKSSNNTIVDTGFVQNFMNIFKSFLCLILFTCFDASIFCSFFASTPPKVRITQGHVKPEPVAFVPIFNGDSAALEMGTNFINIISNDLCGCGLFYSVNRGAFIETSEMLSKKEPSMQNWRVIKARFLVCGSITRNGKGYKITVKLYDVNRDAKLMTFSVVVYNETLRKAAHMASDQIYSRITEEKGMFDTQIVYIETVKPEMKKGKKITYLRRLKIMDQDGANDYALTKGNCLVLSPKYSPDGKTVAYLLYKNEGSGKQKHPTAHVYLLDIETKKQRPLLTPEHFLAISKVNGNAKVNMTYAPNFSPDGKEICFALIINGRSAIYSMNLREGKIRRLTDHVAIDTSPSYTNDGRKILFTSNRSGKEKIYVINKDGSAVTKISLGDGKYSQPVCSPRGDLIAFSKQIGNQFFIGVMRPNGTDERLVLQCYLAEHPSWSPNGRYIAFVRQANSRTCRKICMVDLTGYFMKELNTKSEASNCSWSPLVK